MKRRDFFKKLGLAAGAVVLTPVLIKAVEKKKLKIGEIYPHIEHGINESGEFYYKETPEKAFEMLNFNSDTSSPPGSKRYIYAHSRWVEVDQMEIQKIINLGNRG